MAESKPCGCGLAGCVVVRHPGEWPKAYARRRFATKSCAGRTTVRKPRARKPRPVETKPCACGRDGCMVVRHEREKPREYAARRFASHACASYALSAKAKGIRREKRCACGDPSCLVIQRDHEDATDWNRRAYGTPECARAFRGAAWRARLARELTAEEDPDDERTMIDDGSLLRRLVAVYGPRDLRAAA